MPGTEGKDSGGGGSADLQLSCFAPHAFEEAGKHYP